MAYNPQYCTIIVRNTDGSGYVRQFSTLAEAKAAYAAISYSGASVYLYQPPTKSLSTNPSSTPPPISNTGTQVVENGIERNPFNFTPIQNSTTATMTKIGCAMIQVKDADGVTITSASAPRYRYDYVSGGEPASYEENGEVNTNGCFYPANFKIETTGSDDFYRELKTIYSLDFGGQLYGPYYEILILLGYSRKYIVANGDGTTRVEETVGIPRMVGQAIEWEYYQDGDIPYLLNNQSIQYFDWEKIGNPIPNGNYLVTYKVTGDERIHSGYWSASIINANNGTKTKWVFTPIDPTQPPPPPCSITKRVVNPVSGTFDDVCDTDVIYPYTVTEDCEPPFTVELEGTSVALGYNRKTGMNNGYGDIVWGECSGMIYVPYGVLVFSGTTKNYFSDGEGSYYEEDKSCPQDGSILNSNSNPIDVNINGSAYNVGTHFDLTIADGSCGSRNETQDSYVSSGTYLTEDGTYRYYSNGAGYYYTETIDNGGGGGECLTAGDIISQQTIVESIVDVCGTSVSLGNGDYTTYADGSCGQYTTLTNNNFLPSGTQVGTCGELDYFSDGVGGYYTQNNGSGGGGDNCEDPELHSGEAGWSYDGCHWSYVEPCASLGELLNTGEEPLSTYITELSQTVTSGNTPVYTYADGSCGTYITYGENSWYNIGTVLASDSNYNYLADGVGGYTLENIVPPCDSSGTFYGSTTEPVVIYISELDGNYTAGTYDITTYADGNCGTYASNSETNWYFSGTLIASDSSYNYYSNGSGGYYAEAVGGGGCTEYGMLIGQDNGTYSVNLGCGDFVLGNWNSSSYADGNCGSYTEGSSEYVTSGALIGNCNDYNYYSDGAGSYYQGEYTGGSGCPSYGTELIPAQSGTYYTSTPCGDFATGSWYDDADYADGNCGYYNDGTSYYSHMPFGEFITNCNDYNLYSDGNDGYYTGEYTGA